MNIEPAYILALIVFFLILFAAVPYLLLFQKNKTKLNSLKNIYLDQLKNDSTNSFLVFLNTVSGFKKILKIHPCEAVGIVTVSKDKLELSGAYLSGNKIQEQCDKLLSPPLWIGDDFRNGRYYWLNLSFSKNSEYTCGLPSKKEAQALFDAINR